MAGKKRRQNSSKPRKQAVSRSTRAELQFPVSRVERCLREGGYAHRLGSSTPVFLAGVLKYLRANILDLAGKEAQGKRKKCIAPQHLETAMENNQHLRPLFQDGPKSLLDETSQPKKK
ncbi:histone H2A-beta, sperm [Heterocephalus glaber]|uniref:Histone H2A n=1 Tax=Heterocephalus glaber TaxID=10181 RepID=A0AAX6PFD3_HETGA|nr:histone H2A-beta, sperm [Heterocephalus glaber]